MRNILCLLFLCITGIAAAQLPSSGLVVYYPFNNSSADEGGNKNDAQINGAIAPATDRFGNPCGAFRFIGTGCYLAAANSVSLKSPVNALTIAAWVKPEKNSSSSNDLNLILLAKPGVEAGADIKPQYCFQIKRTFGDSYSTVTLSSDFSFQDKQYNNHPMEFGQWYFIAVTFDEGFVQVYQDSKLICQAPKTKPFAANDFALEIGRDIVAGKKYFNGSLDDLRIYNRGLSMAEVNELYKDESGKIIKQEVSLSFPKSMEKNTESGRCYAKAFYAEPTLTMGCGSEVLKQTSGQPSGSQFNVGRNNLVYETMLGDKLMRDSFQVTVIDNEAPVFKCPTDVVAKARAGTAGVEVYYPALSVTDNCPNLKLEMMQGLKSGAVFPTGTTILKYEATDASGNKSQCSFSVTVSEDVAAIPHKEEAKQVTPYQEERARTSPSESKVPGTLIEVDGAKIPVAKAKEAKPSTPAQHEPNLVITPAGKNATTANKLFRDMEKQRFDCLPDTIITLPPHRKGVIFHYKEPRIINNAGLDSVVQVAGSKDGCFLQVGVHPFIFRAYDRDGSTQTCTFSVMVKEDAEAKPIAPPAQLEAELQMGLDSVQYQHKATLNKCDLTVLIYDDGEQDNDSVSIVFNGEVLVNRDMIRVKENGPFVRNITLLANGENYIIAKAWNTGRFGLNTLRIDVYDNSEGARKDLRNVKPLMTKILHSRPGTAGGLLLKCE